MQETPTNLELHQQRGMLWVASWTPLQLVEGCSVLKGIPVAHQARAYLLCLWHEAAKNGFTHSPLPLPSLDAMLVLHINYPSALNLSVPYYTLLGGEKHGEFLAQEHKLH